MKERGDCENRFMGDRKGLFRIYEECGTMERVNFYFAVCVSLSSNSSSYSDTINWTPLYAKNLTMYLYTIMNKYNVPNLRNHRGWIIEKAKTFQKNIYLPWDWMLWSLFSEC